MKVTVYSGDRLVQTITVAPTTRKRAKATADSGHSRLRMEDLPEVKWTEQGKRYIEDWMTHGPFPRSASDSNDKREVGPKGRPPRTIRERVEYAKKFYAQRSERGN